MELLEVSLEDEIELEEICELLEDEIELEEICELLEDDAIELELEEGTAEQAVYTLLRIGANTFSFTQLPLVE